jgi:hypothetical protein
VVLPQWRANVRDTYTFLVSEGIPRMGEGYVLPAAATSVTSTDGVANNGRIDDYRRPPAGPRDEDTAAAIGARADRSAASARPHQSGPDQAADCDQGARWFRQDLAGGGLGRATSAEQEFCRLAQMASTELHIAAPAVIAINSRVRIVGPGRRVEPSGDDQILSVSLIRVWPDEAHERYVGRPERRAQLLSIDQAA